MAQYDENGLVTRINTEITPNGQELITAEKLNGILIDMVQSLAIRNDAIRSLAGTINASDLDANNRVRIEHFLDRSKVFFILYDANFNRLGESWFNEIYDTNNATILQFYDNSFGNVNFLAVSFPTTSQSDDFGWLEVISENFDEWTSGIYPFTELPPQLPGWIIYMDSWHYDSRCYYNDNGRFRLVHDGTGAYCQIYPNPSTTQLQIGKRYRVTFDAVECTFIRIKNSTGNTFYVGTFTSGSFGTKSIEFIANTSYLRFELNGNNVIDNIKLERLDV